MMVEEKQQASFSEQAAMEDILDELRFMRLNQLIRTCVFEQINPPLDACGRILVSLID